MKSVIETPSFLATAREAGLSDGMREFIVATISDDPKMGDMMAGTGGLPKIPLPWAWERKARWLSHGSL